ncbi:hypothetical protein [Pseudochryseolinea flava]|uniref:Uncharacterized protein n=1 Tax=Pseudochryseolinea flava TaxID=2059302 RepID=A0A364Y8D4_9BACT|nr:hypothetical protein [Pseudochryseolinea flava]RAW03376.1 hypothetical protein DQQ10_04630 [Pseudochryseolinea flava]
MQQKNNEDKLDELLVSKSYGELTNEEKLFVEEELGSAEQYNAMRKVSLALITSKSDLSPDPFIVKSLQNKMYDHRASKGRSSLFVRAVPAYATALMIVVASAISWFLASRQMQPIIKIVEVVKHDTLFLKTHADTIFKDRIIYRTILKKERTANNIHVANTIETPSSGTTGVSMKEKQDLELLLVSGTR